jgi:hypothetical protein
VREEDELFALGRLPVAYLVPGLLVRSHELPVLLSTNSQGLYARAHLGYDACSGTPIPVAGKCLSGRRPCPSTESFVASSPRRPPLNGADGLPPPHFQKERWA